MSSGVATTVSDWLLTGRLGALGHGSSRADVLTLLGEPDDWLADTRKESSSVWRYGAVELGFDDDDAVLYLQVDTINLADPGSKTAIKLEWGPLCHGTPLEECLRWLAKGGLDFDLRFEEDGASIYLSKSYLSFATAEDPRLVNVASPAASQALRKSRGQ